jgi:hypothetical protein
MVMIWLKTRKETKEINGYLKSGFDFGESRECSRVGVKLWLILPLLRNSRNVKIDKFLERRLLYDFALLFIRKTCSAVDELVGFQSNKSRSVNFHMFSKIVNKFEASLRSIYSRQVSNLNCFLLSSAVWKSECLWRISLPYNTLLQPSTQFPSKSVKNPRSFPKNHFAIFLLHVSKFPFAIFDASENGKSFCFFFSLLLEMKKANLNI